MRKAFGGAARIGAMLGTAALTLAAAAAPSANPELVTRVPGNDGADGHSYEAAVTPNGRFVAFLSEATNLVDGDENGFADVFVKDMKTGETGIVSVDSNGVQANGECRMPSISSNGRFVLFQSSASNLVVDDGNDSLDVFLHDRGTGVTRRVSVAEDGTERAGDSRLDGISLSGNGRYAVFRSQAAGLVPEDLDTYAHVYFADLRAGTLRLVSLDAGGGLPDNHCFNPTLSPNGRFIAFDTLATDMGGDNSGNRDVFVFDRKTGTTRWATPNTGGGNSSGDSIEPVVSNNGKVVAFYSTANDLVDEDTNGTYDAFVRDMVAGVTRRVSVDGDGNQVGGGSYSVALPSSGKAVFLYSEADGLVPEDQNGRGDVFVRDLASDAIRILSTDAQGTPGDGVSYIVSNALSGNGKWIAISSTSTNLSNQDRNGSTYDVFLVPAR